MLIKQLLVSRQEIYEFHNRVKWTKIRKFLGRIVQEMDNQLKQEIRSKQTDLVNIDRERNIHRFITKNGSRRLQEYLNQFSIKVTQ